MTESQLLLATLKRHLRARGLTYRDVATTLKLSEASIKRLFSSGRLSLDRLTQICAMIDLGLAELIQDAATRQPKLRQLSPAQENELVADPRLLLVAACALNHWTLADIVAHYQLSETDCLQRLLRLDRLRLIDLLPGNRIRLNVARDFDWLPDGPIRHYFRNHGEADFLAAPFQAPGEDLFFVHGMLTDAAKTQLLGQLRQLRARFAALHEDCQTEAIGTKRGTGLLLALREWEPRDFAQLRRAQQG
mgnify:CR=1 FL=1